MSARVLFVDDDPNALAAYQRAMRKAYDVRVAADPAEALRALASDGPFAAVVSDMRMPGMDGVALLACVRERSPDATRLMLTGADDQRTAADAVNRGAIYRFLTKPCPLELLIEAVDAAVHHHRVVTAERELLEKTVTGSVRVLVDILAAVDGFAFGRMQPLRELARALASAIGATPGWELDVAALLAAIGAATVPPEVLVKAREGRALAGAERDMLARIPRAGADLLANIPRLEAVARIVLYQAADYDGGGFPGDGVAGDDLPLESRLLRVASDLLAAENARTSRRQAVTQLREQPAGRYDPRIVAAAERLAAPRSPADAVEIHLRDLRAGMIVARDIVAADGKVLIGRGHPLTATLIERLHNFHRSVGLAERIAVFP